MRVLLAALVLHTGAPALKPRAGSTESGGAGVLTVGLRRFDLP